MPVSIGIVVPVAALLVNEALLPGCSVKVFNTQLTTPDFLQQASSSGGAER
jgi:hypothetical protein